MFRLPRRIVCDVLFTEARTQALISHTCFFNVSKAVFGTTFRPAHGKFTGISTNYDQCRLACNSHWNKTVPHKLSEPQRCMSRGFKRRIPLPYFLSHWDQNRPYFLLENMICIQCRTITTFHHHCCQSRKITAEPKKQDAQDDIYVKSSVDKEMPISLREDVLTIPNALTLCRIGISPFLGYLIVQQSFTLACGIFVFAGITDLLDGWIARRYPSQSSAFGSFLDPLADKFLVSIVFLSLTWVELIPAALTALIVCRDIGLIAAAFYVRYISMIPPVTFSSFFDVTKPTAELKPMFISKLNTGIQLSLVVFTLAAPVFGYVDHIALHTLWYLTAATTVTSGIGYMFTKDTYRILKEARKKS